ncbi:hypothetical protein EV122DRAFT_286292 [Schizophyllum commune]
MHALLVYGAPAALAALIALFIALRRRRPALPDYFALSGVPPPKPLPHFNVDTAKPRPYRPFRWAYFQHMALKKMEPDWWLELESTYRMRIAQRQALYATHGSLILGALPGSELACAELLQMVAQWLSVRYPNCFSLDPYTLLFQNHILGKEVCIKGVEGADALRVLLDHVPEDFALTLENEKTGLYHMCAGVVCSSVGWNAAGKMGKPLHEIHGPVPHYKERMQMSMDRYFKRMETEKPIQRGSWGLEVGEPLFLQESDPKFAERTQQDPNLTIDNVFLRVDWQTLRRLPHSRAIVFNFKALFTPLTDFRHEPYIPHLVRRILREGDAQIMNYKGTEHVLHKVLPELDAYAREQEEKGWVPKDWKERTLDEDPFYPGWEKLMTYAY